MFFKRVDRISLEAALLESRIVSCRNAPQPTGNRSHQVKIEAWGFGGSLSFKTRSPE